MKVDKSFTWHRFDPHALHLKGLKVAIIGGTDGIRMRIFFGVNPGGVKTDIRMNFFGGNTLKFRFIESMLRLVSTSVETYTEFTVPLLVSPDLEGHSGTMFNRKGLAILPTPKLTDSSYNKAFMAASEKLVSRADVQLSS
jgi:hypothetical protein